jgi:leucine-zipper-like transcriptional regulator 1
MNSTSTPGYGPKLHYLLKNIDPSLGIFIVLILVSFILWFKVSAISLLSAGNNYLVVFGGMGYKDGAVNFDKSDLCIFDDLRLFDLVNKRWLPANTFQQPSTSQHSSPGARYAHLSSLNGNRLTIIGGQDLDSQWLGDIHVYDLDSKRWIASTDYPKYCGAYRSIIVSSAHRVVFPINKDTDSSGFPGVQPSFQLQNAPLQSFRPRSPLIHLPYAEPLDPTYASDLYLYSNYNVSTHSFVTLYSLICHAISVY